MLALSNDSTGSFVLLAEQVVGLRIGPGNERELPDPHELEVLGYADQSHLIRDFKAQIGRTPAQYAAEGRSASTPAAIRTDRRRRDPRSSVTRSPSP